ncbi:MAG TPA: LuxR C-terminal-related transcriptional regulator, partial [Elusimicrobiota bacterium]|nr:LuxR C-terminal-related transcriptional regulator [Elusimicrobiota bacterium]
RKTYLSDAMGQRILDKLSAPTAGVTPTDVLSDRELEVFQFVGRGLKPAAIAKELNLSVKTVETYREQIKAKLNLDSASELVQHAIAWTHQND